MLVTVLLGVFLSASAAPVVEDKTLLFHPIEIFSADPDGKCLIFTILIPFVKIVTHLLIEFQKLLLTVFFSLVEIRFCGCVKDNKTLSDHGSWVIT